MATGTLQAVTNAPGKMRTCDLPLRRRAPEKAEEAQETALASHVRNGPCRSGFVVVPVDTGGHPLLPLSNKSEPPISNRAHARSERIGAAGADN
jgi:hypothetical protein